MEISIELKQIKEAARFFLENTKGKTIFAFYGDMGVGKTTFIKELCLQLGVEDVVNSPTFSIVNEYSTKDNKNIYHFDFYRIKDIEEALNFGIEEYLHSGNLCFIEWPEKIEALLPLDFLKIYISEKDSGERLLKIIH